MADLTLEQLDKAMDIAEIKSLNDIINAQVRLLAEASRSFRHIQALAEQLPSDGPYGLVEAIIEGCSQQLVKLPEASK